MIPLSLTWNGRGCRHTANKDGHVGQDAIWSKKGLNLETEHRRIRAFRPEDQEPARTLILRGLAERWGNLDQSKNPDLDNIARHYADGVFLVTEIGGQIVATGALIPETQGVGRIVRMSVARARRRRGVGRQMLYALIEWARVLGYQRLVLETTATWADAIAFYRAHGFRPVGERDGDAHFVLDLAERFPPR